MNGKEFVAKLKRLNSRIRFFEGFGGPTAGLYLYMPKHPKSNPETGLKHLGAMPSPRFFSRLPKNDFWDDSLGGFNRGWQSVLRRLCSMRFAGRPVINRSEAMRTFGGFFSWTELVKPFGKTWAARERIKEKFQTHNMADYDKVMQERKATTELGMKLA